MIVPQAYRETRSRFTKPELSSFDGRWVAFSSDVSRIIAGHAELSVLDDLIRQSSEDSEQVAFEYIGSDDELVSGPETQ